MSETIKAVEIEAFGGPEAMQLVDAPCPQPGPGEVRVRLQVIGVNLIDTYHRSGLYPMPLPARLGVEGAGEIEAVGDGVDLPLGKRVAFTMALGAYAEAIVLPATSLVMIPDGVSTEQAAAVLLKGMTVDYLFNDTFPLHGGETVLFHAAAGGVRSVGLPMGQAFGRSAYRHGQHGREMRPRQHGATECFLSGADDLADTLRKAAGDNGYPVIYDSVGKDTYQMGLQLLARSALLPASAMRRAPLMPSCQEIWRPMAR